MGRKTVALSFDEDIYEQYQKFCEEYVCTIQKFIYLVISHIVS